MKSEIGRWDWRVLGAVALVALTMSGLLIRGVWRQLHRLRELAAVEAELAPLVAYEQQRQTALLDALEHASSPDYTEEWARTSAGMARPGEVRLVVPPLETPDVLPVPTRPSEPPARQHRPGSFWEELWQRLSGEG